MKLMRNMVFSERYGIFFVSIVLFLALSIGFYCEFVLGKIPCPLCFLQRSAMMGTLFSLYLNLIATSSSRNYGFALLFSLFGMACSLRHIALNVCKKTSVFACFIGPYQLYTWSFLVCFSSSLAIAFLLLLRKESKIELSSKKEDVWSFLVQGMLWISLLTGFFSTLQKRGWSL